MIHSTLTAAFLLLLGLSLAACATSSTTAPQERQIYLLIGQSNMAGRGTVPDDATGPIERVGLLNNQDEWEPAQNPLNRYSTVRKGLGMQKLGPGYGFAQRMVAENPDGEIGLIVNARGGSKIETWREDAKHYREAIRRARAAAKTGVLAGILWHQGESNHRNPDGYLQKLETLVKNLRRDLEAPDLPFVAGQVHNSPAINEQIARLPETVPHTAFVSSEGLKTTDRWHFDTESQLELGRRYAERMIQLHAQRSR
ncbi:MAG: sialate O-acetylesterase [Phycisphaeraceae bacterium]|nr:sialate O-acetylesterase [Phycisphaeraceae bacterium]